MLVNDGLRPTPRPPRTVERREGGHARRSPSGHPEPGPGDPQPQGQGPYRYCRLAFSIGGR